MNPEQHPEDDQPQPNRPHDNGQPGPDRDHGDPDVMPDLEETGPEPEEPNVETVLSLQGQDDPESWTQAEADYPALQATQEEIERLESEILHEQARESRIEPEAKQEEKEEEPQETLQDIVPQDSVSSSVASNDDPNLDGQRRASAEAEADFTRMYPEFRRTSDGTRRTAEVYASNDDRRQTFRTSADLDLIRSQAARQSKTPRVSIMPPKSLRVNVPVGTQPSPLSSNSTASDGPDPHDTPVLKKTTSARALKTLQVNGRQLQAYSRRHTAHTTIKMWHRSTRISMKPETKIAFQAKATGFVLPKGNKLSAPSFESKDGDILAKVHHLQSQLRTLSQHMVQFDMISIFNAILVPTDVANVSTLQPITYDIFKDYPNLTSEMIANSNEWYICWSADDNDREDMNLSFTLLKNNTEETLWNKCMEEYDEFEPYQQGGPLIMMLILKRIKTLSESTTVHLISRLKNYKISKTQGEDVDKAISLAKSTYAALKSVSTSDRNLIPSDYPKILMDVLQTTTVPVFTDYWRRQVQDAHTAADAAGGLPKWPDVSVILRTATNMYRRMKSDGTWTGATDPKRSSFPAVGNPPRVLDHGSKPPSPSCWNCGGKHHLKDCSHPKDQSKIDAARQAHFDRKKSNPRRPPHHNNNNKGKPRHITRKDGTAMVLNKNGAYVVDQKQKRLRTKDKELAVESVTKAFHALTESRSSRGPTQGQTSDATSSSEGVTPKAVLDLQDALKKLSS